MSLLSTEASQKLASRLAIPEGREKPGFVLAAYQDGRQVYAQFCGVASTATSELLNEQSVFRIGSLSKTFCAALFHLAHHDLGLSLCDCIKRFIPEAPAAADGMTLAHLLNMQSGLRDEYALQLVGWGNGRLPVLRRNEILALILSQTSLNHTPGTAEEYSNSGYTLLELILERVSGMPYGDLLDKYLLKPATLISTRHVASARPADMQLVIPYAQAENRTFQIRDQISDRTASGGMVSTLADMMRWHHYITNSDNKENTVLWQLAAGAFSDEDRRLRYGLGVHVERLGVTTVIGQSSGAGGWCADYIWCPQVDAGVVVLSNNGSVHCPLKSRMVAATLFPELGIKTDIPAPGRHVGSAYYYSQADGVAYRLDQYERRVLCAGRTFVPTGSGGYEEDIGGNSFKLTLEGPYTSLPDRVSLTTNAGVVELTCASECVGSSSRLDLTEYEGVYGTGDLPGQHQLWIDEGVLFCMVGVAFPLSDRIRLVHVHADIFLSDDEDMPLGYCFEFVRDEAGKVSAVNISFERMKRYRLERISDCTTAFRRYVCLSATI